MSESETFLSRWLRLKSQPEGASATVDTPSPTPFDPASLPSLESIDADTDMQQFLHEAVPEELTRAALRNAWTADPAIRDFVGIAENQWNFNDHACIPGFGPLEAADYLATQALHTLTNAKQEALQDVESVEAVPPAAVPPSHEETTIAVATAKVAEQGEGEAAAIGGATPQGHGGALPQ